jgi:hypothetical protein
VLKYARHSLLRRMNLQLFPQRRNNLPKGKLHTLICLPIDFPTTRNFL